MNKKNDIVHVPVRIIETNNDDIARSSIEMKNNQVEMKERSYSNTKEPDVDAAAPRKSIWKKHETVIQERIVRHIWSIANRCIAAENWIMKYGESVFYCRKMSFCEHEEGRNLEINGIPYFIYYGKRCVCSLLGVEHTCIITTLYYMPIFFFVYIPKVLRRDSSEDDSLIDLLDLCSTSFEC